MPCTNKKDVTSSQRQHVLRFSVTSADGLIKWFLLFQERSILHSTVIFWKQQTGVAPGVPAVSGSCGWLWGQQRKLWVLGSWGGGDLDPAEERQHPHSGLPSGDATSSSLCLGHPWTWSMEWSRAKANRVLPRKCTGHNKHPLPTTQEKTLYMDITRWSTPKSDWLYSLQPKMEKLYTLSKNKTRSWLWLSPWTPYCQIQTEIEESRENH